MSKRIAIFAMALALLSSALSAGAQGVGKVWRVGFLSLATDEAHRGRVAAFRQGLRDLGYVDGRNILIHERYAAGRADRLREQASDLVRMKVDVIVVHGALAARVANEAGRSIPIVFAVHANPVGTGLVASLARPGGNVTGLSDFHGDLVSKRIELLKEVVPSVSRVAVLWNPGNATHPLQLKSMQAAAPGLGVTLLPLDVGKPGGFDRAFAAIRKERVRALMFLGDPMFSSNQKKIVEFAVKNGLPAISTTEEFVEAGGLISYGADHKDLYRRAALYVDKILKGAKPADLPVEQPTKFDLVINLKTAKTLGITIPPEVLQRADRVIK